MVDVVVVAVIVVGGDGDFETIDGVVNGPVAVRQDLCYAALDEHAYILGPVDRIQLNN